MKAWILIVGLVGMLGGARAAHAGGVIVGSTLNPAQAAEARRAIIEGELRQQKVAADETLGYIKGIESNLAKQVDYVRKLAESVSALQQAYRELSARDLEYDPDVRPPGSPSVPVSCRSEACDQCFTDAQEGLRKAVFSLEKLRIIYKRTKTFTDKAIAFGDNASGIHAVTGLAWQTQRRGIEASLKKFEGTYDGKRPELMGRLRTALDGLAACEARHYANPDWYDRFGFIYYQFMESKYAR